MKIYIVLDYHYPNMVVKSIVVFEHNTITCQKKKY